MDTSNLHKTHQKLMDFLVENGYKKDALSQTRKCIRSALEVGASPEITSYEELFFLEAKKRGYKPEEGRYAWKFNKEYQEYISKAEKRGLKLAFRIFFDNGTPDWVYEAGSESTLDAPLSLKNDKQPYYDDSVFLSKLENFIAAFAEEYDDPSRVDFVDAYGLGRWGEGHGVTLKDPINYKMVIEKVTDAYARNFKNILMVYNLSYGDWRFSKPLVFDKLGFIPRRDGIGSRWYNDTEREYMDGMFPYKPLIGEGTFWFGANTKDTTAHTKEPFLNDTRFPGMRTWTDVLSVAVEDGLNSRSNTFDLRTPFETKVWIEQLPHKVQKFITHGGYRLYPDSIYALQNNRNFKINHFWRNFGVGVLPNNNPNWNQKYKISFALLKSDSGIVIHKSIDAIANPGNWVKEQLYSYYNHAFDIPESIESGKYLLAVSIIDVTTDATGIKLSVNNNEIINDWAIIGECVIE